MSNRLDLKSKGHQGQVRLPQDLLRKSVLVSVQEKRSATQNQEHR
mgnify:CR=1 FL=1